MSQLPPWSRGGTVRAPSLATRVELAAAQRPQQGVLLERQQRQRRVLRRVAHRLAGDPRRVAGDRSASRRFHSARRSCDGAQPRAPGAKAGEADARQVAEEQKMPSMSQIALAASG